MDITLLYSHLCIVIIPTLYHTDNPSIHTCRITMAFSMLRSSEGRPSLFHISCSLSVLRNRLRSNPLTSTASIQFFKHCCRTSSGAEDIYVTNAAANSARCGNSASSCFNSPT